MLRENTNFECETLKAWFRAVVGAKTERPNRKIHTNRLTGPKINETDRTSKESGPFAALMIAAWKVEQKLTDHCIALEVRWELLNMLKSATELEDASASTE